MYIMYNGQQHIKEKIYMNMMKYMTMSLCATMNSCHRLRFWLKLFFNSNLKIKQSINSAILEGEYYYREIVAFKIDDIWHLCTQYHSWSFVNFGDTFWITWNVAHLKMHIANGIYSKIITYDTTNVFYNCSIK